MKRIRKILLSGLLMVSMSWQIEATVQPVDCLQDMIDRDKVTMADWQEERDNIDDSFFNEWNENWRLARRRESREINRWNRADANADRERIRLLKTIDSALGKGHLTQAQADSAKRTAESLYRIQLNQNYIDHVERWNQIAIDQVAEEENIRTRADDDDKVNNANRDSRMQSSYADYLVCSRP